jgi:hypothetical protein
VAGSLGSNPLPVGSSGAHNIADVVCAPRERNAGRLLVDQDVESPTFQVPVGVLKSEPFCSHHGSPLIE